MTDEASRLLREARELIGDDHNGKSGRCDLCDWVARYDALAALPAAAPRTFVTDGRLCKNCGQSIVAHRAQIYCPVDKSLESQGRSVDKTANSQGEGASVIAPNPTGAQGQSTMQASNVTGNSAMSEQNAEANGLSRAHDDAADHTPGPWHIGGTFLPGSPDAHCSIWSAAPAGYQSGDQVAQYVAPGDARLIAAAPDLLAALRGLIAHVVFTDDEGLAGHAEPMLAAYRAIARTEGTRQHAPESTDAALGRLDTTK